MLTAHISKSSQSVNLLNTRAGQGVVRQGSSLDKKPSKPGLQLAIPPNVLADSSKLLGSSFDGYTRLAPAAQQGYLGLHRLKKEMVEARTEKPVVPARLEPVRPKESDTPRFKQAQASSDLQSSKLELLSGPTHLPQLARRQSKSVKSNQFGEQSFEFTFSEQVQASLPAISNDKRHLHPSTGLNNLPQARKKLQDRLQVHVSHLHNQDHRRKDTFSKSFEVRPRSDGERANSRPSSKDLFNQRKIKVAFKALEAASETDLARFQQISIHHKHLLPSTPQPPAQTDQNQKQLSQSLVSPHLCAPIDTSTHTKGRGRLQTPPKPYNPVLLEQRKKQGRSIITINHNIDPAGLQPAEAKPLNGKFFFKKR